MRRVGFFVSLLYISVLLSACGGDKTASIPEVKSPHGVVLLFDEATRKASEINTCSFESEAASWVKGKYPGAEVSDKGWSSSAYYFMMIELPDKRFKVFFDGTIISEQRDDC